MHLRAVAGETEELRVRPSVKAASRERLDVVKSRPGISFDWLEFPWGCWVNGLLVAQAADAAFCPPDRVGGQVFITSALCLTATQRVA